MAFACYVDDSGTDPQSTVVTIAGLVGPVADWAEYEITARKMFQSYDIEILHTVDFHHKRGEFTGWSEDKKESFTKDLADILYPHYPIGVSVSIDKNAINKKKQETKKWPSMSPLGCGFVRFVQIVHHKLFVSMPELQSLENANLSLIIESGNKNDNELRIMFQYLRSTCYKDKLTTVIFCNKSDSYAVQTADFLAYYTRRWMNKCNLAGTKIQKPKILELFSENLTIHSETITDIANLIDGRLPSGNDWFLAPHPSRF